MSEFRNEKIANHVRELAATFIERESTPASMITVTGITLSPDGKYAKILISVLPKEKEQAAWGFVRRNLGEMRKYMQERLKINPIPYLEVLIDEGEKHRQKIDELLDSK
jgi:ribosome-binding factor A